MWLKLMREYISLPGRQGQIDLYVTPMDTTDYCMEGNFSGGKISKFTAKTYLVKENLSILRQKIMRTMLSGIT